MIRQPLRAYPAEDGLDFLRAIDIFDGRPTCTYHSPRRGEDRWVTIGEIDGRLFVVVGVRRGGNRRIISACRADTADVRKYRALHG